MATRFRGMISTHIREEYVRQAIDSVLRQASPTRAVQRHRGDVLLSTTGVVALDSGIMVNHPPEDSQQNTASPVS